jgi:two-component system nitrate/nitrite response regulator NarL
MTRVLVAEDDPLTRSGIELLLRGAGYEIVATAATGTAALDELARSRPDLLILDIQMPERSGLDVLRTLRNRGDNRPVILLTGNITDGAAKEAMALGVNGLVIKSTAPRDLTICLETVIGGRRWLDQEVLQRAMEQALTGEGPRDPLDGLSSRERAIAALIQRGLKNKEIAAELGLTEGTVKVHLHNIYEKLGVRGRTELVLLAQGAGA